MKKGIIYKATNLINGKCYIGQTTQRINARKNAHIRLSKNQIIDEKNKGFYILNAIKKYGKENFKWDVIFECDDRLILNVMETFKIIVNHSHYTENGYNLTWGGGGISGWKHSEETKKKIGEYWRGRKRPEETKKRMSEVKKNQSEETRRKNSDAKKGNQYGKKYSEDIRYIVKEYRDNGMKLIDISRLLNIPILSIRRFLKCLEKKG